MSHLLPAMLVLVENQGEDDDPDRWSVKQAAHVCLGEPHPPTHLM